MDKMLLNGIRLTIKGQRTKEACLRRMSQSPLEGTTGSFSSRYLSRKEYYREIRGNGVRADQTTSRTHVEEERPSETVIRSDV